MKKSDWTILKGRGVTPDNLTVGGYLDLEGTGITNIDHVKKDTTFLSWKNGKYILVDKVFTEVISHHGKIWKVKHLNREDEHFLITDGNGKYAHGKDLKEEKADLVYKVSQRDKSEFKHLTNESKLSFSEAIETYRVITGSCSSGVRSFIESKGIAKKSYTVKQIIDLTKEAYGGNVFRNFIENETTK